MNTDKFKAAYNESRNGANGFYTHPAPGVPDAAIDSAIYNQCPDFDDWHEGPSIDDIRAIVRAAMLTASPAQKGGAA